jgi:hypothetical protein
MQFVDSCSTDPRRSAGYDRDFAFQVARRVVFHRTISVVAQAHSTCLERWHEFDRNQRAIVVFEILGRQGDFIGEIPRLDCQRIR